ncbi:MAG: hypothetical protein U9R15_09730 [Chloroflexota bacterium]|nr:hypothetical protein [Chloroflexota bacterium]
MFKFKTYAKAELVNDSEGVLKKDLAGQVDIPKDVSFDLMFFKAIYLTSGANLNNTYFDKGELVRSIDTVANKAMDIEHEEQGIVGHIYAASFFKANSEEEIEPNKVQQCGGIVDVVIAGVVYKDRFPELASEIAKGEWFVSMETYYDAFDIMVGEMLFDYNTATSFGIVDLVGEDVTLKKAEEVIAVGTVNKVVKNLHFSGGGFVKEPANPTSFVLSTSDSNVIEISTITVCNDNDDDDDASGCTDVDLTEARIFAETLILEYSNMSEDNFCYELVKEVESLTFNISKTLEKDLAKKWTTKYINSLPNSAFIIVEPAYRKGKIDNKNARHLPYKDANGEVDLPHLRNALARCNQIKAVTDSITTDSLRSKACSKAKSLAKKHLKK